MKMLHLLEQLYTSSATYLPVLWPLPAKVLVSFKELIAKSVEDDS